MSEAVDLKDALERVQDDKELLAELFEIFLEDYPPKREILGQATESGDGEKIREIAHGLKGATGNISAVFMHQNCKAIEIDAKEDNLAGVSEKLIELDQQFDAFKAYALKFIEENGE